MVTGLAQDGISGGVRTQHSDACIISNMICIYYIYIYMKYVYVYILYLYML